jgi:hypothetical protein|tara:strand:+ start:111 stop:356 length:246 start_codon:yes stop_codon:yes gene_type:complete
MASAIDATLPADNVKASKADFRAQFLTIKNEISALQKRTGVAGAKAFYNFVDANDLDEAMRIQHSKQHSLPQDLAYGRVTL